MSNGYVVAAAPDMVAAHEIGDAFGLDVIDASAVGDAEAVSAALAGAPNVGLLLSSAAAEDPAFIALLQRLAHQLTNAQLILADPGARPAFLFLPETWPAMSLDEARARAAQLTRQRAAEAPPAEEKKADEPVRAGPLAPGAGEAGAAEQTQPHAREEEDAETTPRDDAAPNETFAGGAPVEEPPADVLAPPAPSLPPSVEPPRAPEPPPRVATPAPAPQASRQRSTDGASAAASSAPADASAFAPKKLRRGTPELVRIVIHQPKNLKAVIKAARQADPRTDAAPQSMSVGDVELGAKIGVALEVNGAACDGALQRRTWEGAPIDFNFTVEADADVKQAVFVARIFIDDAQIGTLAFIRKISGPAKKPAGLGDPPRLKRHKRVFLSYSSQDRETVAAIATAYQMAGVEHFFDRTSLKSGEQWHPRLRREIDRADLFHLCWSKAAAQSEWVEKETEHALTRQRRTNGKTPAITVQMLDGPPWAPHPPHLDAINFDDFVRAAIVGYARGEG